MCHAYQATGAWASQPAILPNSGWKELAQRVLLDTSTASGNALYVFANPLIYMLFLKYNYQEILIVVVDGYP